MATFYEPTPRLGIGDDVKTLDEQTNEFIYGVVTAVCDESFEVQWDDLKEPTQYEFCEVEIIGTQIYAGEQRKVAKAIINECMNENVFGSWGGYDYGK